MKELDIATLSHLGLKGKEVSKIDAKDLRLEKFHLAFPMQPRIDPSIPVIPRLAKPLATKLSFH